MFVLEALRAKHGDALLLHWGTFAKPRLAVIDGGPPGVFADALQPRLAQLRAERGLADEEPLPIDLAMVSHIDDDHVAGLLQMMQKARDLEEAHEPAPWRVRRFWHNAFDDLLGNDEVGVGVAGSAVSVAALSDLLPGAGSNLLASVPQGRNLAKLLRALGLDGNPPFGGLVRLRGTPVEIDGLKLTVVAPLDTELAALQTTWDEKIKPLLKKERTPAGQAEIAAFVDDSVFNLASLVVLVEKGAKRILLTGDARGDHTLAGLEAAGRLKAGGKLRLDVLKVPHHGSDRNVTVDYFRRLPAKHYLISADGKHDNPDVATLEMIAEARPDDAFTIHLTYPTTAFTVPAIGKRVARFVKDQAEAGRRFRTVTRKSSDLGIRASLD